MRVQRCAREGGRGWLFRGATDGSRERDETGGRGDGVGKGENGVGVGRVRDACGHVGI